MDGTAKISLEDKDAIRDLLARYCHAIDSGDCDGVAACFLEDAVFHGRAIRRGGHAEIRELGLERTPTHLPRHLVTNILIAPREQEPDVADVKSHLLSYAMTSSGISFMTSGTYQDVVVKTTQGWKFRTRVVNADVAAVAPP